MSSIGRHGRIYTREEGRALLGEPNCRCSLLPYIPSIQEVPTLPEPKKPKKKAKPKAKAKAPPKPKVITDPKAKDLQNKLSGHLGPSDMIGRGQWLADPDMKRIYNTGRFMDPEQMLNPMLGVDGECHWNVAKLYKEGAIDHIQIGYAQNQHGWHQHTWGIKNGKIVETTASNVRNTGYYGTFLEAEEAVAFAEWAEANPPGAGFMRTKKGGSIDDMVGWAEDRKAALPKPTKTRGHLSELDQAYKYKADRGYNNFVVENDLLFSDRSIKKYQIHLDYKEAGIDISADKAEDVLHAIEEYTNGAYPDIRNFQFGRPVKETYKTGKADFLAAKKNSRLMEEYLDVAPSYIKKEKLYRGMQQKREFFEGLKVGDVWDTQAMSSWSSTVEDALGFAQDPDTDVIVKLLGGSDGSTSINYFSAHEEAEVLLSGRNKFKITSMRVERVLGARERFVITVRRIL